MSRKVIQLAYLVPEDNTTTMEKHRTDVLNARELFNSAYHMFAVERKSMHAHAYRTFELSPELILIVVDLDNAYLSPRLWHNYTNGYRFQFTDSCIARIEYPVKEEFKSINYPLCSSSPEVQRTKRGTVPYYRFMVGRGLDYGSYYL